MNHLGRHGMPAGLYADWNDCLRLGKDGESTFVALQFYYAMTILKTRFIREDNPDIIGIGGGILIIPIFWMQTC